MATAKKPRKEALTNNQKHRLAEHATGNVSLISVAKGDAKLLRMDLIAVDPDKKRTKLTTRGEKLFAELKAESEAFKAEEKTLREWLTANRPTAETGFYISASDDGHLRLCGGTYHGFQYLWTAVPERVHVFTTRADAEKIISDYPRVLAGCKVVITKS